MATLVSPGASITITDESQYGSTAPGTVPLIVIATAANKPSPSGTGLAPYTTAAKKGKLFPAKSQREFALNFGNPYFWTSGGTQLHGHELNEYGAHAAYQCLGIVDSALILRADIDLLQLLPSDSAPRSEAINGTHWLDLSTTRFGVFQSNGGSVPGTAWVSQTVKLPGENDVTTGVPKNTYGANGDYAVVTTSNTNLVYEKVGGTWLRVGSTAWKAAHPTTVTGSTTPTATTASHQFSINGTTVTLTGTTVDTAVNDITTAAIANITAAKVNNALVITNTAGGDIVIANVTGTALTALGIAAGTTKGVSLVFTNNASYPENSVSGDVWIKGTAPNNGADWKVKRYNATTSQWIALTAPFYAFDSTLSDGDVAKDTAATAALAPLSAGLVYVGYDAATGVQQLRRYNGTAWATLVYEASVTEPTSDPEDGALWYSTDFRADIMVGNGSNWQGYKHRFPNTDPVGVQIAGSAPTTQSDGTALVEGDLWIDSSDLENYPALYRFNETDGRWGLIDKSDQTTPFGIVFADARQNSGPTFTGILNAGAYDYESETAEAMALSDYLDPDAPDARAYPNGMLLFNTRYSTYNVKVWRPVYFNEGGYDPNKDYTEETYTVGPNYTFPALADAGRWVTASGNTANGSPYMGRKAQRAMVVKAMAAAIAGNTDIRSEVVNFNLIVAPGYPELLDEMVLLNRDQKETAFIIGDTPARLVPTTEAITAWATNSAGSETDGEDGLASGSASSVTASPFAAIYYPWGLSTNVDGSEVMVPPSTIALRTYLYNDQVAYPWMAPSGFTRGLVDNVSAVGYLTDEGEFKSVILNQSQRDALYANKINPIAYMPGRGLVVRGQKTLSPTATAMDRVNVARLAIYLKANLDEIVAPFEEEPNDFQTRDAARVTVTRFLTGLVTLRALEDFAVVCDETNNTPERRDRNELWIDIAIKPVKAIEFIYVPIRVVNSSAEI